MSLIRALRSDAMQQIIVSAPRRTSTKRLASISRDATTSAMVVTIGDRDPRKSRVRAPATWHSMHRDLWARQDRVLRSGLQLHLLRDGESVVHLDPEISNGALQLRVLEQQLYRSQVAGLPVNLSRLRSAQRMRAVRRAIETGAPSAARPRSARQAILLGRCCPDSGPSGPRAGTGRFDPLQLVLLAANLREPSLGSNECRLSWY